MSEESPTPIRPNRQSRRAKGRATPGVAEVIGPVQAPIKTLDAAQGLGLNASQSNLDRAAQAYEQAKQLHIKILESLGLDPNLIYEITVEGHVFLKK